MTKENLRDLFCKQLNSSQHWGDLSIFDEFFESNVVIPRGANRHPYADVFHEAMEDTTKIIQFEDGHAGCDWTNLYLATDRKHRIKPSEPVWEYQWYRLKSSGTAILEDEFYTAQEINSIGRDSLYNGKNVPNYSRIEETKRERR